MNALIDLLNFGQSYWLDNLTRKKISSGELQKRVSEQGLRGITSNPSIFNKAISKSNDYDEHIASLVKQGKILQEIYDALTIKDVQDACDILHPVYISSQGVDGFVSLEVPPYLSRDAEGTIRKGKELFKEVGRTNCLIKVPGTKQGLPAIEELLYEGININVTLLFSIQRYEEVAKVYISALQRRLKEGKKIDTLISVASIFISRIDVLTDQLLAQQITPYKENSEQSLPELLQGKVGVATARLAYKSFEEIFSGFKWGKLEKEGAHVQRPLWASTSNKDPLFGPLRYVEPLIGKDTVNTLPDETIEALAKFGRIEDNTIDHRSEGDKKLITDLKKIGIDLDFVTQQLENEGVQKFTEAYNELISNLAIKRAKIISDTLSTQTINIGDLKTEFKTACDAMDEKQIGNLLFAHDPYLWKKEGPQLEEIRHRLGWLDLPEHFEAHTEILKKFAGKVKDEKYTHTVLLGMGGSSLCSEVARETYGHQPGYLELLVLDNTSPEAILNLEKEINLEKTIFIIASKSGNTEETLSFFRYFYEQLKLKNVPQPGNNFIAITDAGTPLVKLAEHYQFRKIFLNNPDLGGRYSVLSDFGLVPMAMTGVDIDAFLASAREMEISCYGVPALYNPGISLGVALGICQKKGRDKITFVLSSSIGSFGYWVEQLLAESTGKEGKGLIPVNGEELGDPDEYCTDRLFVHMYLKSDDHKIVDDKLKLLEDAGHPVIKIGVATKLALGGEYYRWEIAAAVSGLIVGINPFDQPNVEESKKNTSQLLEGWKKEGTFHPDTALIKNENISVYAGKKANNLLLMQATSTGAVIDRFTSLVNQGDYIAMLPYFMLTEGRTKVLQNWRNQLQKQLKVATTLLGGPRYLHSTGQLHKGGPDSGVYLIIVANEGTPLAIPGEKFGFDILHQAQALGDFLSLDDKGRRVIRIHIGKDIDAGLDELYSLVKNADPKTVKQLS